MNFMNVEVNNYDMKIINTDKTSTDDTRDYLENKYSNYENLFNRIIGNEYE